MDKKVLTSILLGLAGAGLVYWMIQQTKTPAPTVVTVPAAAPAVTTSSTPNPNTNKLTQIAQITSAANAISCLFATGGAAERCGTTKK